MESSQLELVKEVSRGSSTDTERFLAVQTQQALQQQQYFYDLYRPFNQWCVTNTDSSPIISYCLVLRLAATTSWTTSLHTASLSWRTTTRSRSDR